MLNREITWSAKMNALPDDTARLLATWTIPHLDVNGVFHADPVAVRSLIFPTRSDVSVEAVSRILDAMETVGLIVRFEALGRRWQYWPGFRDNQTNLRPERERPEYPPYQETAKTVTAHIPPSAGNMTASIRQDAGKPPPVTAAEEKRREEKRKEEKLSEEKGADAPEPTQPPTPGKRISGMGLVFTEHEDPRVKAYLELIKPEITQHNAELICRRVSPDQLETWKGTLTLWAESGWNRTNFTGMFERFETRVNTERVKAKAGGQLFGKPAVVGSTGDDYERVKAILEARARGER
jgi:hypothetical protein